MLPRRTLLALPLVLPACAKPQAGPGMQHPLAGKPVASFKRSALSGELIDTQAMGDRKLVLKFFADYCIPCKRTLPEAQRVHEANPSVLFVGISEDETPDIAQKVARQYGLTFPIVFDQGNVLSGRFRASEMPVLFVVSAGKITWVGGPDQTEAQLDAALKT